MLAIFDRSSTHPAFLFLLLVLAAALEACADSYFQTALHRSHGFSRVLPFAAGMAMLAGYAVLVNLPRWEFGHLLGMYAAVFFVVAQICAWARFGETPSRAVFLGGALMLSGAAVVGFGQR